MKTRLQALCTAAVTIFQRALLKYRISAFESSLRSACELREQVADPGVLAIVNANIRLLSSELCKLRSALRELSNQNCNVSSTQAGRGDITPAPADRSFRVADGSTRTDLPPRPLENVTEAATRDGMPAAPASDQPVRLVVKVRTPTYATLEQSQCAA